MKIQFNYNIIPRAGKHLFGSASNILPLISSLCLTHKVPLPLELINECSAVWYIFY